MSEVEQHNGGTMENEVKEVAEATKEEDTKEENAEEGKEEKEELKKEEDEGEDDDEEESSDEEELPLGSVEAPVQIMTGKRDRKKTDRLVMVETPKTPEKKFEVPEGKGTKLGDIAMIAFQLEKFKIQDLKPLHRFLFGKIVKDIYTKKNIRLFSGFNFDKEDPEFAKREALLWKFTMEGLREVCTILDVEKKGNKEQIMERVIEFCFNPQPSGRAPPDKGEKKAKAKAKAEAKAEKKMKKKMKKMKKQKDGSAKKKKKTKTKAGGDASQASEDGDTTMEETTEEDSQGDSSMAESDSSPKKVKKTPKPKKSTPKKDSAKKDSAKKDSAKKDSAKKDSAKKDSAKPKSPKKKKVAVKTPSKQTKKASPVKSAAKKTPQKRKQDEIDNDSSDDEPLLKKAKQPPSDSEIKKTVEKILEGANLEEVTMKMVCRKVYDTFPEFPLQHKKDYIKSTVRDIIS